jgi:DNA-binding MarR family transcriptional regulator
MERKGLFNKVKNRPTRRRFLVSTIRKGDEVFETGVFVANFFYIPRHLSQPDLAVVTHSQDEALELHYKMTARLTEEHPMRVLQDYIQATEAASAPNQD